MRAPSVTSSRMCPVCGQRAGAGRCSNQWCSRADRYFSVVFSVGVYAGALRRAILGYKFRGEFWRAPSFARLVAGYLDRYGGWFDEFDMIGCMPTYVGAGGRRSWDPVGLVLSELEALLGDSWMLVPNLVGKRFETTAMSGQGRLSRLAIAEGPLRRSLFVPDPTLVRQARILLFDDVFTEGSSLREVARVLLASGAVEVAGLALARPQWDPRSTG